MIRDPSDGSVREKQMPGVIPGMSDAVPPWKAVLLAGKVKPEKLSDKWAYQRAWNDGIDWSIQQMEKHLKSEGT